MNQTKPAVVKKLQERFRNIHAGRNLYTAFLVPTILTMVSIVGTRKAVYRLRPA